MLIVSLYLIFLELILEKTKNFLPEQSAQLNHIFAKRKGHLENNPSNQKKLLKLINNDRYWFGTDIYNCQWYIKSSEEGGQFWAKVYNHKLSDGGYNKIPRKWNSDTGLCTSEVK